MMRLLSLALWVYIVLWAALLIHCVLKRRFYPIFGRGLGTKVFWLFTFAFMNPLLTVLYLIFGVIFKAGEVEAKGIRAGGILSILLVLVTLGVFELPSLKGQKTEVSVVHNGQEKKKDGGFQGHVGILEANNNHSTMTSSTQSGNARFYAKSIVIRSKNDHLLIDKVCRFMQENIVKLPYVEEVAYCPVGAEMNNLQSHADIMIVVDARKINESGIGINHKLEAEISCFAGTEPVEKFSHSHYSNSPPLVRFSMNNKLKHSSTFKGIESSKAKYKQQSENIGKQFVEAITKQFDKWIEEHGLLPELPEYMYSREVTEVGYEFLKDAKLIYHGGGLMRNYRAVWSYEDERENAEAFREVRDILREHGWHGGDYLDKESEHKIEYFTMSKDYDHIEIFRMRGRSDSGGIVFGDKEGLDKKLQIAVEYLSLFTREQINDVLGKLFASEAALETKLIFEKYNSDESVKQLLFDAVESQQIKTMGGYLLIGRYYANRGEMGKATEALITARVMSRAKMKHGPASNEIKSLAKKIGDESLAKAEIGIEYYQRAGFIDISTVYDGVVYERSVDEPLMFYTVQADEEGFEKIDIKTVVTRISKAIGTEGQYEVEIISKRNNGSSWEQGGLSGSITLHDSLDHNKSFRLDVERLDGERFKLTVRRDN
jgi:hypothetical protein